MALALSIIGVTFTALYVWLTVRVVNRRERWAKWTLSVGVAPMLYFLSTGPAIWLRVHGFMPEFAQSQIEWIYWPIDWMVKNSPETITEAFWRWAELWGWKL